MNVSTLYPKLPSAPPICTEELDPPNRSQLTINIESPGNQHSYAEESKTKDITKHPIIKLARKTFFICVMGFFFLALPILVYALVKARDRSYWID